VIVLTLPYDLGQAVLRANARPANYVPIDPLSGSGTSMSHQADFYAARRRDAGNFSLFQLSGTTVDWSWEMADDERLMTYAVASTDTNVSVTVERTSIRRSNDNKLSVLLTVTAAPFDAGGPGATTSLNFFAIRVPPL
jgi:hypothetical protein